MLFDILLADEKIKPHQVTTLHLLSGLAFVGTGAIIAVYNYVIPGWGMALLVAGLLIIALTILRNKWVLTKNINRILRVKELLISLLVAGYSLTQHWKFPSFIFGILSASVAFAIFWERNAGAGMRVVISDDGVRIPNTRRRFLPWTEVESLTLQFGTLTINSTDNNFFQWATADNDEDYRKIEEFCSNKIEEHIPNRRKDDW